MSRPCVLLVGGLDSSAGAGLIRDAATVGALGLDCRVVATAVTAQSDNRLAAVHPVPAAIVEAQLAEAGPVAAVKLGMLGDAATVDAVVAGLPQGVPVVLDPVLRSSSGGTLLDARGLERLMACLLPCTTVLTPNRPELAALAEALDVPVPAAVAALLATGCGAVLVKGGHGDPDRQVEDVLHRPGHVPLRLSSPRWPWTLRGTGCQLASAIAAHLALGESLEAAVTQAHRLLARRFAAHAAAISARDVAPPPAG